MRHGLCRAGYIPQVGCQRLLRLNSKLIGKSLSKSTLGSPHSALSRHIVNRIFKFVLSLDINVQHMEDQRKTCEPILDSKSLRELQDFLMKSEFSLLLSSTQRLWSGAQNHIRMVGWLRSSDTHSFFFRIQGISEIKANLDAPQSRLSFEWLFGNRQAKLGKAGPCHPLHR